MAEILSVTAGVLTALSFVLAWVFVISYLVLFNPRRTTGGWMIWRSALSIALIGVARTFEIVAPGWWGVAWLKVFVFAFVVYCFASLIFLLFYRRFSDSPNGRVAVDEDTLIPKKRR